MRTYILIAFILTLRNFSFATAQIGDLLIEGNDTSWINSNPLEEYFKKKGNRKIGTTDLGSSFSCTALWRGYVATWRLENDSLFLVRIQSNYCDIPSDILLEPEFGKSRIFASWVNSIVVKPLGEMLQYIHDWYRSIYEGKKFYTFHNGMLRETKNENYLERDNALVFPGEDYLNDTLKTLILAKIDSTERALLPDSGTRFLLIRFNEQGRIVKIGQLYSNAPPDSIELLVISKAQEALKNFPQLMRVNHEDYFPPQIQLIISVYCLKNPNDRVYGCNDE
jgi:hypothetical protein